jgi:cytochrome bd-type quinol oxidase subunit 2
MILALTLIVIILLYVTLIQRAVIYKYKERDASLRRMWDGELENNTRLTGFIHAHVPAWA